MLFTGAVKVRLLLVLSCAAMGPVTVSCGGPQGPELSSEKQRSIESGSGQTPVGSLPAASSSGERTSELTDAVRFKLFSKPLDPLTIQKGGNVKFALPLTEEVISSGILKSAEFRVTADGVTGSIMQGKTLSVNVGEDAAEGRYIARLVFRLSNGRESVQNLQLSVIP